tara:strand:- start:536 stop:1825 length:1290 start_codon:yes stop_codon:yes gene_type:complete
MEVNKFYKLAKKKLFHLCRSITGPGTKQTLKIIKQEFSNLKIKKFKSGKKVFDWKVPPEWEIKDGYVLDLNKKKIINFKDNNLHIINYSTPINKVISREKLLKKIFSLRSQPDAIPYVTSYYKKNWGFCVSENFKKKLKKTYKEKDKFKVFINSNFKKNGNLHFGELILKGKSSKEILISTNVCHPSMANNELSGPILSMSLINYFKKKKLNKTIRFIFIPETIGSISYISENLEKLKTNLVGGYNLSCVGDERMYSCIFSKEKNSPSDFALKEAYKKLKIKYREYSFLKRGSDERQYNSPGVDLPVTSIFKSKFGTYKEYHTSLDNFDLVTKKGLQESFILTKKAIEILQNKIFPNSTILCEPFMSKRNLYREINLKNIKNSSRILLDFLQYSNGKLSIEQIAKKIKVDYKKAMQIYKKLLSLKLLVN